MHFSSTAALLAAVLSLLLSTCSAQLRLPDLDLKYEECLEDREYSDCGCRATCSNYKDYLETCDDVCKPGCYCQQGHVEYNGKCILFDECPRPGRPGPPPTIPPPEPYPVYPYPSKQYPYDPYEPYDPYDPYPFQYCELNEDEYGRPYYGPYDRYLSEKSYPPRVPEGYPSPPTRPPPGYLTPPPSYPTRSPPGYPPSPPPYRPYPYPVPTITLPPPETYAVNLTRTFRSKFKRQALTLSMPTCIHSNECYQKPETCTGYGTQYDRCDRRCTCRNGILVDCCRVRKEWHSMTQVERCRYVDAVYTVSTQQPFKDCYDDLIEIHRVHFSTDIHGEPYFFPWHRWFILSLENLLRQVDCKITVPYWDWSAEAQTWQNSIVWAPQCGLGGNGSPVTTGVFRSGNWRLTPSAVPPEGPLERDFRGNMPDCAAIALAQRLGVAEFSTWHDIVQLNLHDTVHCIIDGTMCSRDAANAPEFFLHHGFIDQLWASWQNKGPGFKNLPHYTLNTTPMPGAYGATPRDMYDLDNQPGCVRVCIEPSSRPCRTNTSYTPLCPRQMNCYEYSPRKLAYTIPRPYPRVPTDSYKLFNTPLHKQRVSDRCTQLFNSLDDLNKVLEQNGYQVGKTTYRPALGEVQLNGYIYQPQTPVYPSGRPTGPTYTPPPPPPPVCRPYVDPYIYGPQRH